MNTLTQFFKNQTIDAESTAYLWTGNIMNIIVEGTWDSANMILQAQLQGGEFVDFLTFTKSGYAIVENLLPGVYIRFKVTDAGASTDLTCNVIKG